MARTGPTTPNALRRCAGSRRGSRPTGPAAGRPRCVHGHDWQAGAGARIPACHGRLEAARHGADHPQHRLSRHWPMPARLESLRLNPHRFTRDGFEFWGQISALKAGLMGADRITTVSPDLCRRTDDDRSSAWGWTACCACARATLSGILNGIDAQVWNPATDPAITPYKTATRQGRQQGRAARRDSGCPRPTGRCACVVSRLTEQKGLDLLLRGAAGAAGPRRAAGAAGLGRRRARDGVAEARPRNAQCRGAHRL